MLCLLHIREDIKGPLFQTEPRHRAHAPSGDRAPKTGSRDTLRESPPSPEDIQLKSEQVKGVPGGGALRDVCERSAEQLTLVLSAIRLFLLIY